MTLLEISIFQEPSLEGGWIRIDVDTFVFAVRVLRDSVLRNTPSTFNLANLTVRLGKPDGQRWLQLCPQLVNSLLSDEVRESNDLELIAEARRLGVQRYFDRPLFVTLRLSIEYALPEMSSAAAAPLVAPSAAQLASASAGLATASSQQQQAPALMPPSASGMLMSANTAMAMRGGGSNASAGGGGSLAAMVVGGGGHSSKMSG